MIIRRNRETSDLSSNNNESSFLQVTLTRRKEVVFQNYKIILTIILITLLEIKHIVIILTCLMQL